MPNRLKLLMAIPLALVALVAGGTTGSPAPSASTPSGDGAWTVTSETQVGYRRDNQYRSRIMSTDQFPTSTFTLASPIALGSLPGDGATVGAKATGDLTLRGVTKSVTFDVKARRSGDRIEVNGAVPVVFEGVVEFLLVLAPARL